MTDQGSEPNDALRRLKELEDDPRLCDYEPADVFVNAPLALIQCELRGEANGIRLALGLPRHTYPFPDGTKRGAP